MCKGYGTGPVENREPKQLNDDKKAEITKEKEIENNTIESTINVVKEEEPQSIIEIITAPEEEIKQEEVTSSEIKEEEQKSITSHEEETKREEVKPNEAKQEEPRSIASRIGAFFSGLMDKFASTAIGGRVIEGVSNELQYTQNIGIATKVEAFLKSQNNGEFPLKEYVSQQAKNGDDTGIQRVYINVMIDRHVANNIEKYQSMHPNNDFSEKVTARVNDIISGNDPKIHLSEEPKALTEITLGMHDTSLPSLAECAAREEIGISADPTADHRLTELVSNITSFYEVLRDSKYLGISEDRLEIAERIALSSFLCDGASFEDVIRDVTANLDRWAKSTT
jgi:hypothetical protein